METCVIKEKQDLTYLTWSKVRNSSGTGGSFLKAQSELDGTRIYYKLSNYDSLNGVVGHESVNEIIVDRLLTILGIEHLNYQLISADICIDDKVISTYVCASENYRNRAEDKIALDVFYEAGHVEDESPLDFCIRMGWGNYIWQMLIVDFLILNRDRHGANIEVLRDRKAKTTRLAPLFDHGLSLLCRCGTDEEMDRFDVIEDRQVQCFVGSGSTRQNLELIPGECLKMIKPLKEEDRSNLFEDLDGIISDHLQDQIWNMIWKRWCYYEDFCNSRRNRRCPEGSSVFVLL